MKQQTSTEFIKSIRDYYLRPETYAIMVETSRPMASSSDTDYVIPGISDDIIF